MSGAPRRLKPPPPDRMGDPPAGVSSWNLPNALTAVRIALVPVFAWLLFAEGGDDPAWRVAAFLVFTVAALTDLADGHIARKRGLVTTFGKVADPIADKALMGTALVGLSLLGELAWWVTAVILVREVGVTLLRFWVIRHGVIPASPADARWVVMGAALVVTVATGVDYCVKAVRLRQTSARAEWKRQRKRDRADGTDLAGPAPSRGGSP